ncbi:IclR family transcriptional regulator [Ralstonia soli]|uniref:IclR family transcriptional regulator n=1 Tax=Ralstonia soli TaxID=2953896 RepID=A0ABT1AEC1_9RALS|nr:IclR family transcriptional regulator [Ralstonia soli]MCO5396663.1 IclR family transcriptional regulator [Ralstonia soli]
MPPRAELITETAGAQTLRRGLGILKLLARYQPGGLGVSDIARKLELNKATAVRLTRTLMDEQFVAQDAVTRRYQLGPESFAIGLAAEPNYALQRIAAPALRALALETGDWLFFTVRHELEAICLSRESGDIPYPAASLQVGDRHPLGLGAGGLAILAAMPDEEAERILKINIPEIGRRYPQMTEEALRKLIAETREQGYAVIPGTLAPGFWGIGVPVLRDGQPVAAIVLNASAVRLSAARQAVIAARLQKVSRDLMLAPSKES